MSMNCSSIRYGKERQRFQRGAEECLAELAERARRVRFRTKNLDNCTPEQLTPRYLSFDGLVPF